MYVEQMYKKTQENVGKHKALGRRQRVDLQKCKTWNYSNGKDMAVQQEETNRSTDLSWEFTGISTGVLI